MIFSRARRSVQLLCSFAGFGFRAIPRSCPCGADVAAKLSYPSWLVEQNDSVQREISQGGASSLYDCCFTITFQFLLVSLQSCFAVVSFSLFSFYTLQFFFIGRNILNPSIQFLY